MERLLNKFIAQIQKTRSYINKLNLSERQKQINYKNAGEIAAKIS